MCGVARVVVMARVEHHRNRIGEIQGGVNPCGNRYRNRENDDAGHGLERDGGKQDAGHAAGCADGGIARPVFIQPQGKQVARQHRAEKQQQKSEPAINQSDDAREKIQREQIEKQMPAVGVQEGGAD